MTLLKCIIIKIKTNFISNVEGIVDLKEKEWICSFNIDSVTNVKGNFKYKEDHPLVNKDTYKLYFASLSYEFYYYGADYVDRPYVGGNNYYVSQNITSFTLYYVNSYTDTNTFLSNIYPNKDSTTALTNCSLIKLDYYFSVIYCTLTSDEIENLPESNNSSLSYDILCGSREIMAATLNKFNSDNYPIFKITEFILPERKIVFYDSIFFISADIEGNLSGFNNNKNISFSVFVRIENEGNIYYEILLCNNYFPTKI